MTILKISYIKSILENKVLGKLRNNLGLCPTGRWSNDLIGTQGLRQPCAKKFYKVRAIEGKVAAFEQGNV